MTENNPFDPPKAPLAAQRDTPVEAGQAKPSPEYLETVVVENQWMVRLTKRSLGGFVLLISVLAVLAVVGSESFGQGLLVLVIAAYGIVGILLGVSVVMRLNRLKKLSTTFGLTRSEAEFELLKLSWKQRSTGLAMLVLPGFTLLIQIMMTIQVGVLWDPFQDAVGASMMERIEGPLWLTAFLLTLGLLVLSAIWIRRASKRPALARLLSQIAE